MLHSPYPHRTQDRTTPRTKSLNLGQDSPDAAVIEHDLLHPRGLRVS